MEKIKGLSLHNYIGKGAAIIYIATAIMCCAGMIFDIITLHKISNYVVTNNLVSISIILVAILLYYFKVLNMPVSFAIIIYSVLVNITLDIWFKPYGNQNILYFFQNSFFIIYLITIASLNINKIHGIIVYVIYSSYYIIFTLTSGNKFLNDTMLFQLTLLAAYTAAIYFFVDAFEKLIRKQVSDSNTILEQNNLVKGINILLKERQLKVEEQGKEMTKINKKLTETVETKDKFFSIIAHDLKNPLSALMGFSEVLYNEFSQFDEEHRNEIIKIIYESSKKVNGLLDNLLIWSRMQTSGIKANPDKFNLYSLIIETSRVHDDMRSNKKIKLEINVDKSWDVYTDMYMLNSVINNLLSNAIKFTKIGGTIGISAELTENKFIRVCISDSGVGISQENIPKLFRIDRSYSTEGTNKEKGSGLGLPLCKEFVERNGGTIWVESGLNNGSQFYFTVKAI